MFRIALVCSLMIMHGCVSTADTRETLGDMYNVPSSGASQFDGYKYIRISNMVCSNSVVFELYQDTQKAKSGLVLVKAGSNSITNIGGGESLLFKIDGETHSFKPFSKVTEYDKLYFDYGVTVPFSHKSYLVPEALIRKAAASNVLLAKVYLLNNTYVEGKCSPVTLQEAREQNGKLGAKLTQVDVDTGNSVAAIHGFREFIRMMDSTAW